MTIEYQENGEIFDYLEANDYFPEELVGYYFHQLVDTVCYMH